MRDEVEDSNDIVQWDLNYRNIFEVDYVNRM